MASTIKVNNIQNQCGANIANKCGSTITLGASGDTITLACGASQTGFGRTGTVDWDTTAKTASFTAVSGNGYFVNTTSGAITVTLPAGSAGDIVGISDYASTFQTNNVTITPNGTDKINGVNDNAILSTQGLAVSLVYVDSTRGWKSVTGSDNDTTGNAFINATGGTITEDGDFKVHTFTGPGTFCISSLATIPSNNTVDYLVVAGGAGGGQSGGGGGAGGFRTSFCAPASNLPVSVQGYPVTVGGGGFGGGGFPAPTNQGGPGYAGSNSVFSTITSSGGGGGGGYNNTAGNGGSGGGGGMNAQPGGSGNTPPVSPPQGNNGGPGVGSGADGSGGGGGASAVGGTGVPASQSGVGGAGSSNSITGSAVTYAGGGGGGGRDQGPIGESQPGAGGAGGGGAGGNGSPITSGVCGTANTGGAGGGSGFTGVGGGPGIFGGSGGSGIVIIRYKYQ